MAARTAKSPGNQSASDLHQLNRIWEARKYDLDFYFSQIFERSLDVLRGRVTESGYLLDVGGIPVHKALFLPVGFAVQNVALMAALLKPRHLTFAFSETTHLAHRAYFHKIRNKITEYCPGIQFDEIGRMVGGDQLQTERVVVEWAEGMKGKYGVAREEMAIDLTGGTKPMSIGAQNAAMSLGIPAFYLSILYAPDTQLPIAGTESLCKMPLKQSQTEDGLVFVIMPFAPAYEPVYEAIKSVVTGNTMQCTRVDQEIFGGGIIEKVMELLRKAEMVIAELSEPNENVYYELGLAHAWSKPVVMLTDDTKKIPFDLKNLRHVVYSAGNTEELRKKLPPEIAYFRNKKN